VANADLYQLLEVDANASTEDLKKNYRRLARELHPDANPGDSAAEARFKEVSQAYEILSDPDRRAHYDRFGADAGSDGGFGAGSVQDIFDMFFSGMGGGGGRRRGPQPGQDAQIALDITLFEAAFGAKKDLEVSLPDRCETCSGNGCATGTSASRCSECNGSGEVRRMRNSILGQMVTTSACQRCQGVGESIASPCPTCHGDGRTQRRHTLNIDIPSGVENGSVMRLNGRGPAGPRGGPNGTLFVHLQVAEDPRFERHDDDLHYEAHVAFTQATLGTTLDVPTLEDNTSVTVPPGSAHGTVIRLRDLGVPHLRNRGRSRGDLFVHLAVDVPTVLDETSERLLRELAEHRGETVTNAQGLLSRLRGSKK